MNQEANKRIVQACVEAFNTANQVCGSDGPEDRMRYTRIYADADGASHCEDVEVKMNAVDFAPPAPPLDLSEFVDVTRLAFLRAPAGWVGDWHPAPRRQLMIHLAGHVEAETSDRRRRKFGPGSAVLAEDTTGKGHRSRVIGTEEVLMAVVQLNEEEVAG